MTVTILLEQFVVLLILGVLLILLLVLIRVLNFNFIRIQADTSKLIVRYYSLYSIDRSYESIEFPAGSLRRVKVKKYLFGLKWDLYLTVKLKQGMADYPAVCLSAVPGKERRRVLAGLNELVRG